MSENKTSKETAPSLTGRAGGESGCGLASKYSPAEVEGKWYQYWLDNKLFSSKPDGREPYTVVIPPPNVTGDEWPAFGFQKVIALILLIRL